MRARWMMTAMTAVGIAAAAGANTPQLATTLESAGGTSASRQDAVGPIGLSSTDRWGTLSGSVDYGALRLTNDQRLVSLGDFGYVAGTRSSGIMRDTISLRASPQTVRFLFELTPTASATATGFGMTQASVNNSFTFAMTDLLGTSSVFSASYSLNDRPGEAMRSLFSVGVQGDFTFEMVSGTGRLGGRTRYAVTLPMFASSDYQFAIFGSCSNGLTGARALDVASTRCGVNMRWLGATGEGGRAIRLDSASFQNWTLPYRAPAARLAPMAMNQPALLEAVPEPATWAMMIAGFGLVGVTARRRVARAA